MDKRLTPEQITELREKIKNMSPEELKEFQKKQCIFCQIHDGKVSSKKIYEDEVCLAILDINPANPGHILLMPKEHYTILPQVPPEEIRHLFVVAKKLSNAALRAFDVKGTNIIVANGIAAGQKAQHMMIHIIPRKEKDGLNFKIPQTEQPLDQLEVVGKKLAEKLGGKVVQRKDENAPTQPFTRKKELEADYEEKKDDSVDLDAIASLFKRK